MARPCPRQVMKMSPLQRKGSPLMLRCDLHDHAIELYVVAMNPNWPRKQGTSRSCWRLPRSTFQHAEWRLDASVWLKAHVPPSPWVIPNQASINACAIGSATSDRDGIIGLTHVSRFAFTASAAIDKNRLRNCSITWGQSANCYNRKCRTHRRG